MGMKVQCPTFIEWKTDRLRGIALFSGEPTSLEAEPRGRVRYTYIDKFLLTLRENNPGEPMSGRPRETHIGDQSPSLAGLGIGHPGKKVIFKGREDHRVLPADFLSPVDVGVDVLGWSTTNSLSKVRNLRWLTPVGACGRQNVDRPRNWAPSAGS
jgi:hypothetical protein